MWFFLFAVIFVCFRTSVGNFQPNVTLQGCSDSTLTVTLTDARNGGIIYIKGQGQNCIQPTFDNRTDHVFDFFECDIEWGKEVEVVVQKSAKYQTTSDRIVPVLCLADTGLMDVGAPVRVSDKTDTEQAINKTVKPTAAMSIFKDGVDISGDSAKLGDALVMNITLASAFVEAFDIRAFRCKASALPIIEDHCPVDVELFPSFTKPSQGVLLASFTAFRPTDLKRGSAKIAFSCALNVCRGLCGTMECASDEGVESHGLVPNRHVISKRAAVGGEADLVVGTSVKIYYDHIEVVPTPDVPVCNPSLTMLAVLVGMVTGCAMSFICAVVSYKRFLNALMRLRMIQRMLMKGERGAITAVDLNLSIKTLSNTADPIPKEVKLLDFEVGTNVDRRSSTCSAIDRRQSMNLAASIAEYKRRASMASMYGNPGICAMPYN